MNLKEYIKKFPIAIKGYVLYIKVWNKIFRKHNVAMMHIGRVGSTVLGDMMNQHPKIFWDGEPFERLMMVGTNKPQDFVIQTLTESSNKQAVSIYSFATKFMPEQHLWKECINMNLSSYLAELKKLNIDKFIFIKRENYLKQVISVLVGRKKKEWHSQNKSTEVTKITIDILNYEAGYDLKLPLFEYFKRIDKQYELLENLIQPEKMLILSYEKDIEKDPFIAYNKVCEFLGIKNANPNISFKKTNPFSLKEMIENYNEVRSVLNGTKFSWMLDE